VFLCVCDKTWQCVNVNCPCVLLILTIHIYDYCLDDDMLHYVNTNATTAVLVEYSTHQAMQKIHAYTPKFNIDDEHRVTTAVEHYEPFINFDELLTRTKRTH